MIKISSKLETEVDKFIVWAQTDTDTVKLMGFTSIDYDTIVLHGLNSLMELRDKTAMQYIADTVGSPIHKPDGTVFKPNKKY